MTERFHEINTPKPTINWPVILFLIVQTGGAIWWMAATSTTLDSLKESRREAVEDNKTLSLQIGDLKLKLQHVQDMLDNGWRPVSPIK
jgi:hypothetical protein